MEEERSNLLDFIHQVQTTNLSVIRFIDRDSETHCIALCEGIWGSYYAVCTTRACNAYTFLWVQQGPLLIFCYSR